MALKSEKFTYLLQANQILSSTLDLSTLLHQIMKLATDVVEAETSSILLYDEKNDELVFDVAVTDQESKLKEVRIQMHEGIAGEVATTKKPKIVNDMAKETNWKSKTDDKINFKTRSILAVPLLFKDRLLGVVEAVNKIHGDFTTEDLEVMEAFAAQASVSIENAILFNGLKEEKEKLEAIFTQMSDGAIYIDIHGTLLLYNNHATALLGKENITKTTLQEVLRGFESDPPIDEALTSGREAVQVELHRAGGKTLYLSGVVNRIVDSDKKVIGFVFIFRDTTTEKKESMLQKNFLSLISHKLKTPLVTITGYGPILLSDATLNTSHKKAISSIHRQGMLLASLVDKLLYFTLTENEDFSLHKKKASLAALIDTALAAFKSVIEEKSITIEVAHGIKDLPLMMFDADKIEAVIKNIIENAIKFNGNPEKKIIIEPYEKDGLSGLSIMDNGPGIPPEEREKVFEKFYQIEESFTGQVEGVGLGLTLVKHIIESHGGKCGVESGRGQGSMFYFVLPKE